jgi:hypothetical protein
MSNNLRGDPFLFQCLGFKVDDFVGGGGRGVGATKNSI